MGPIISSLSYQLHLYIKVMHIHRIVSIALRSLTPEQTHLNIRTEAIFTQLVFDHAIRARVNTTSTEIKQRQRLVKSEKETDKQARTSSTPVASSSTAATSDAPAEQNTNKKTTEEEAQIQAGSIANLLTVDMTNLTGGIDFAISVWSWLINLPDLTSLNSYRSCTSYHRARTSL